MAIRNARIYLDQNLLGYIRDGKLRLSHITGIDWIYSTEHFREVARSGDPTFIQALETIDAQHLEVLLDERWRILDRAVIASSPRPLERYFAYTKAKEAAPEEVGSLPIYWHVSMAPATKSSCPPCLIGLPAAYRHFSFRLASPRKILLAL